MSGCSFLCRALYLPSIAGRLTEKVGSLHETKIPDLLRSERITKVRVKGAGQRCGHVQVFKSIWIRQVVESTFCFVGAAASLTARSLSSSDCD